MSYNVINQNQILKDKCSVEELITSGKITSCNSDQAANAILEDRSNQLTIYLNLKTKSITVAQGSSAPCIIGGKKLTSDEIYEAYGTFLDKEQVRNLYRNNE